MSKILLVHPDGDFAKKLSEKLCAELSNAARDVFVDCEQNMERARARIEDSNFDYNLVITRLRVPKSEASIQDQKPRGLMLVRELRALGRQTPAILIAVMLDADTKVELCKLGNVVTIEDVGDSSQTIVDTASSLMSSGPGSERLCITFSQAPDKKNWSCDIGGAPFKGVVGFKNQEIEQLQIDSEDVGAIREYPQWLNRLVAVGKVVREKLVNSNPVLARKLSEAIEGVGGIEHTRLCFKASQSAHGIALEAVLEPLLLQPSVAGYVAPQAIEPFWMLRAPVYRMLDVSNVARRRLPLFVDEREDLNVLIIEANAAGMVTLQSQSRPFGTIKNVAVECEALENWFMANKVLGTGEVYRFSAKDVGAGETYKQRLQAKLTEKQWHIVHYAGHSCYVEGPQAPGTGYMILPGDPIQPVQVGEFATWLKHAQLVVLSSCESATENFVFEMARSSVPAVIGFRWKVDDDVTTQFMTDWFYPSLFDLRSIEEAFQETRRRAHNDYPQRSIWAAPMLIVNEQIQRAAA